jgi:hypothetical protein
LALFATVALALGCGGKAPPPPAACDQACQDGIALRSLRVAMRLAFNLEVASKPVGMQEVMVPCPPSGNVHIVGDAESNALLGTSQVNLTYTITDCLVPAPQSTTPERNYSLKLNGVVTEAGTLAMGGPTTALMFTGTGVGFSGTVYDPPVHYEEMGCTVQATQDGNNVTGTVCDRPADGFSGF